MSHLSYYLLCELSVFHFGGLAFDYVYSLEQTHSSNVSHEVIERQNLLFESLVEVFTCFEGVLLQFLPLDDVKYSVGGSHSQGVASEGAEELHISFAITLSNLSRADHCGHWKAISHSFSNGYDIGYDIVVLEGPEGLSQSSETSLNLVSDADDVALSQYLVDGLIELFGRNDLSSTTEHVLADEGASVLVDDVFDVFGIVLDRMRRVAEVASIEAGTFGDGDVIWFFVMFAPFIGTDFSAFTGDAMIGSIETDNSFFVGVYLGHLESEVVGFGTAVDEGDDG